MLKEIPKPRANISPNAPKIITISIKPDKIRDVVGPGGKTINKIIDETGADVNIEDDGTVFFTGKGALTFGVTTSQVFCDSREGLASPDLQLLFTPGSSHPLKFGQLDEQPGMSCVVCVVKPDSRGTIMAASSDPFARPHIKPNYLTAHTDELALLTEMADELAYGVRPRPADC